VLKYHLGDWTLDLKIFCESSEADDYVSGVASFQMAKSGPLRPTSGKSVTNGISFATPHTLY
jgi:hypothetical protein